MGGFSGFFIFRTGAGARFGAKLLDTLWRLTAEGVSGVLGEQLANS